MRKTALITIIALVLTFVVGITVYAATKPAAGSADDPLVSRSYVDGAYSTNVIKNASATVDAALNPVYSAAVENASGTKTGDTAAVRAVGCGGSVTLSSGATFTMTSGTAAIAVPAGTVSDVTGGTAAKTGSVAANHKYIVGPGGAAVLSVSKRSVFITAGSVTVAGGTVSKLAFADVKDTDWFYDDVAYAVELKLIGGMNPTTFAPNGSLTLAQAVKLAACIHQQYADGAVTLQSDANVWYMSYVRYCVAQGILDGSYGSKTDKVYNAPITRREFAHIFYKSLPESGYTAINTVKDNAIPDVKLSSPNGAEIYTLYRAGILTGDGASHQFNPTANIKRSEVSAIVARMMDTTLRQSVTLG